MSEDKKLKSRILRRQARLLWQLVTTTAGVADLAEPIERVEHHFDRLTKRQQTTVAVIAHKAAEGFHAIKEEEKAKSEGAPEVENPNEAETGAIEADEVIPPEHETGG